ncbi:hypothetical protein AN958_09582 [Leucoagaricus sp. SymC.cos]|nr:hypothetical protein AN958_09582 [Leucoagaricus sp. SymC.cos]
MQFRSVATFVAVTFVTISQASPISASGAKAVIDREVVPVIETPVNVEFPAYPATEPSPDVEERGCRFWCI